jgi:hypothetical protein
MATDGRKRKVSDDDEIKNGKRPRIASPDPVVLDEFETEAQREVEANAGLTGAEIAEGQKISLSHQVSDRYELFTAL